MTVTFTTKLGATTVATSSTVSMTNSMTDVLVNLDIIIPIRAIGVSGAVKPNGKVVIDSKVAASAVVGVVQTTNVTVDTTASKLIDILLTWGTASASNSFTLSGGTVEILH